jgi:hypothetical protein
LNGKAKLEMADRFRDGFFEASAPASKWVLKGSLGEQRLAETARTHWRAIDRDIPSQLASPHCLSPFFHGF